MHIEAIDNTKKWIQKLWFYQIIVGSLFLIFSLKVIVSGGEDTKDTVDILAYLFLLTGIGNIIYAFGRVGEKYFRWGEIFFWGVCEIFSGWLILSGVAKVEKAIVENIGAVVEKITGTEIKLDGYFIIFYIGIFLIFRGISYIVTKVHSLNENEKTDKLLSVERLLVLSGIQDLIFGIAIVFSMFILPELFGYVIFFYILFSGMVLVLLGLNMKYTLDNKEINPQSI